MTTHLNHSNVRTLTGEELLTHRIVGTKAAADVIGAELDRRALHGCDNPSSDILDTLASGRHSRKAARPRLTVAA